ncbi:MAG: Thiol-disulfide oxidoreductase ResA [Gemmatimonadaceae bacterium]|nr:Thiol-disulfide oxidoreductase ResA [Gemmatimonadaceae bacterium]
MRMLLLAGAIVSTAAVVALPVRAQDSGIAIGAIAPGAAVETLDGKAIDLDRYLGKTPVLIQFWATWCPNCKALEPKIDAAIRKYTGRVRFVAVAVSVNQSVERVKAYREKHGMLQDILWDRNGLATDAYEVPATSYIVVVDAKGKVVYTGVGSDQDIDAAVRKAL